MIMNEPKRFHIEPFSWFRVLLIEAFKRLLYRTIWGSKYAALIKPFKVLYRTFFSKSVL